MKVIGVTGSIGSGKTTASAYLKSKGFSIFDADEVSRAMTSQGGKALKKIREVFGDEVFLKDGNLNRKKMADIVFSNKEKKEELEKIVTRKVVLEMKKWVKEKEKEGKEKIVFLDVPLLFESRAQKYCHEVWTIACDDEIRLSRILGRGDLTIKEAKKRIASQMPQEEKIALSDVVIYNNGSRRQLLYKLNKLIKERRSN